MVTVFVQVPLMLLSVLSVPAQLTCGIEPVQPSAVEAPVLAAFDQRVFAYMAVHHDVERSLSPQRLFDDAEDMFEALEAMRTGIRAARPDARRGSVFSADVGALIRTRVEHRLAACNEKVEDVLAFINEERMPGVAGPELNAPFPWALGSAMWPSLLAALPPLPDELQYRFADRDLVLIDMHADLVVDILENALPAATRPHPGKRRH